MRFSEVLQCSVIVAAVFTGQVQVRQEAQRLRVDDSGSGRRERYLIWDARPICARRGRQSEGKFARLEKALSVFLPAQIQHFLSFPLPPL